MAKTKAEVRNRAAEFLGILEVGQSLESQHVTRIEAGYDEIYDQLKEKGLATWASTGSVPDAIANLVAGLVAENCLDTYGVSPAREARILRRAARAMRDIPLYVVDDHASQDEPRDY